VLSKGSIRPELWEKTFYPTWAFGSVTYMDWYEFVLARD
jgi:hypothetical protein